MKVVAILSWIFFVLVTVLHGKVVGATYVGPRVRPCLEMKKVCSVLVELEEKPDVTRRLHRIKEETGRALLPEHLISAAEEHQGDFVHFLSSLEGIEYRTYWISNHVAVDGVTSSLFDLIVARQDVVAVYLNHPSDDEESTHDQILHEGTFDSTEQMTPPGWNERNRQLKHRTNIMSTEQVKNAKKSRKMRTMDRESSKKSKGKKPRTKKKEFCANKTEIDASLLPYHILEINAHKLWECGYFGEGAVSGVSSWGTNVSHEALTDSYRGYDKTSGLFNHTFNWLEAFSNGRLAPFDPVNVGTHITGTIAGTKNNIGVAPESKYISCKVIDDFGRDSPESQLKCYQFFYAPHDPDYTVFRPDLRPDVVSMTWCEGCEEFLLIPSLQRLREAGVVAITPSGPRQLGLPQCGKIIRPPANYQEIIAVSALNFQNQTLGSSAAGPALVNMSLVQEYAKPDFVNNGIEVVSSVLLYRNSTYFPASGSPVANAVFTGAVALLMGTLKEYDSEILQGDERDVILITEGLQMTAMGMFGACDLQQIIPNNEFGYGIIDVYAATKYIIEKYEKEKKESGKGKKRGKKSSKKKKN